MIEPTLSFLLHQHPYDALPEAVLIEIASGAERREVAAGEQIYALRDALRGLYIVVSGRVCIRDEHDSQLSLLEHGNSFGERGLLRDGIAVTSARAEEASSLLCIPRAMFERLRDEHPAFRQFFDRGRTDLPHDTQSRPDLTRVRVEDLMAADPVTCTPSTSLRDAARTMRDRRISCLCVVEDESLTGIVTLRDLASKALAEGRDPESPVSEIMTPRPRVLPPSAIGSDVLNMMMEHGLGHLPIVSGGRLAGIVTQTDLTRFQASNAAGFVAEAAQAPNAQALAAVTGRIPALLVQLVGAGHRHDVVTRFVTDIADVVTRRLLTLAEAELGPAPARFVWLACGSQGRQEQTGVSDQDNCIVIEDGADADATAYFQRLARFVSDGLNACGYVYCPGDMMATNPRWRQTVSTWREYFRGWIRSPSKEAQMLASVMFDLRPIGGDSTLFNGLQEETLEAAAGNSIFTAHMASNAMSHQTPLGLIRGFATIRSGEHRNTIDMKLNGVMPVVDLSRMYALQGRLKQLNSRARIEAAIAESVVSDSGGRDLLDAYDLVAETRLEHQARRIRAGERPDNYLAPTALSSFERSHLRDAFVVIKTMQSALMQGRGVLG